MKFSELLKFSFGNLWRRKLRTSLTVLGVMIGTASIVVMMSLGIGLNYSYVKEMENSATLTRITINYNNYDGGSSADSAAKITDDSVQSFESLEHVTCASAVYNFDIMAQQGKYTGYITVYAMSREMLEALKMPIVSGELPAAGSELSFIIGQQCAYNFNDGSSSDYYYYSSDETPEAPVSFDQPLFVIFDTNAYWNAQSGSGEMPKKYLVNVSAQLSSSQNGEMAGYSDYDYSCYADIAAVNTLFQKLFGRTGWPNQLTDRNGKPIYPRAYQTAYVLVDSVDNVTDVQNELIAMGYSASSELDYLNMVKKQYATIQYVLAGIGGVSLLVAAIGIANTMLMSIFERTKEIGIFKVLGCSMPNIRSMFLTEAGLIGFSGGVAGLILSFIISKVINLLTSQAISVIPLWLAAGGAAFAVLVGIVSGLSPAIRAMKLSPLEAIRTL